MSGGVADGRGGMTRRQGLREDRWARIAPLLPGRVGPVGGTARDNRLFVEAVLYRYRTGVPWRDLPERFGDRENVHWRFSRRAASGTWERIFSALGADADDEDATLDATIVRAHQHSAGASCARNYTPRWTRSATPPGCS